MSMIAKIIAGTIGGASMSLLGYLRKPESKFDWKSFVPNIIVAGIFGGIAGYMNLEISDVEMLPYAGAISQGTVWLWKAIIRRIMP